MHTHANTQKCKQVEQLTVSQVEIEQQNALKVGGGGGTDFSTS